MQSSYRCHYYGILLFLWWICTVQSEEPNVKETGLAEYGSYNQWAILTASAVHVCISIGALMQIWNDPTPSPERLSPAVKPLSYMLTFTPEYKQLMFFGHESLLVEVHNKTSNITLHAQDLMLNRSSISVSHESTGQSVLVIDVEEEEMNQWIIIRLESELHQGELYRVNISYTGHVSSTIHGILKHSYDDTDGRWIMLTHFEPNGARYAFPCFDEPSFKARFTINIATPPGVHALSNMPLIEASEPVVDHPGWFWSRFQESVPMSTYLVGFVLSDLVGVHGDRNFSAWVQPGKETGAALMVQLGPLLLTEMEIFTGLPYMLPKQDNIAIPSLPSMASVQGTENWGLITYTDINIIFEESDASIAKKRIMVHILAHELAHNWFGNLVTPKFWDELWLKEGFARYMQFYASSKIFPTWDMEMDFQMNILQRSLLSRDLSVLNTNVNTDRELLSKYNMRTYDTGSMMIQMMEHILTTNTFLTGIRDYLKTYSYQAASSQQFFEVLDAAAVKASHGLPPGVGIGEVMKPWLSQTRYPLITVTRDYSSGQVTVCQNDIEGKGQSWWVPLSYTTQSELNFNTTSPRLWLSPNDTCINVTGVVAPDEWIIFNIRQKSYYRVNYDQQNWQMLSELLNSDEFVKIDITNRAQLLDDAIVLSHLKLLDKTIVLNVTEYLQRETNPFLWFIALKSAMFRIIPNTNALQELSKSFYDMIPGLPLDILTRNAPQVWERAVNYACSYVPECIEDTYSHFKKFQANPSNYSIDPGLKEIVFCGALEYKHSKREDLMFLWNMAKEKNHRSLLTLLQWCPSSNELIRTLMGAIVTDGSWLTSSERSNLIVHTCSLPGSMNAVEEVLMIQKTDYSTSVLPIDLYLIHKSIISISSSIPIIKMKLSQVWCTLIMSWMTGTMIEFSE